jgi:hypothetical protein
VASYKIKPLKIKIQKIISRRIKRMKSISLEQETFSKSDSLNGSSSSLRTLVTDCESIGSTLGMVSQSTCSSSTWFSSFNKKWIVVIKEVCHVC